MSSCKRLLDRFCLREQLWAEVQLEIHNLQQPAWRTPSAFSLLYQRIISYWVLSSRRSTWLQRGNNYRVAVEPFGIAIDTRASAKRIRTSSITCATAQQASVHVQEGAELT
eukprot:jgi/Chlat1/3607/Chrsp235S03607